MEVFPPFGLSMVQTLELGLLITTGSALYFVIKASLLQRELGRLRGKRSQE